MGTGLSIMLRVTLTRPAPTTRTAATRPRGRSAANGWRTALRFSQLRVNVKRWPSACGDRPRLTTKAPPLNSNLLLDTSTSTCSDSSSSASGLRMTRQPICNQPTKKKTKQKSLGWPNETKIDIPLDPVKALKNPLGTQCNHL